MDEALKVGDTVHRWKTWYRGKKLKSPLDAKLMIGQVGILRKILPNKYVIQTSKDGKPYIACFSKKDWTRYPSTGELQAMIKGSPKKGMSSCVNIRDTN